MGSWGIENVSLNLSTEIWQSLVSHNAPGWFLLCILGICLCYPLVHQVLLRGSSIYAKELTPDQRTVVLQHAIEALVLVVLYIPFTYTLLSVFFQEQPVEVLADKFILLGAFMAIVMTMYMFEIATRFSNLRPVVVIHHLCAYMDGIFMAFFLGTANIKAAFLLVYFICYEAIIFVGLVMYRLAPTHRYTCPTILTGMAVFGLSRPVQLVWVVGSLWASGFANLVTWQVVLQLTLTVCFTALQMYSLSIHYSLYKKAARKRQLQKDSGDETDKQSDTAASSEESAASNQESDLEP